MMIISASIPWLWYSSKAVKTETTWPSIEQQLSVVIWTSTLIWCKIAFIYAIVPLFSTTVRCEKDRLHWIRRVHIGNTFATFSCYHLPNFKTPIFACTLYDTLLLYFSLYDLLSWICPRISCYDLCILSWTTFNRRAWLRFAVVPRMIKSTLFSICMTYPTIIQVYATTMKRHFSTDLSMCRSHKLRLNSRQLINN